MVTNASPNADGHAAGDLDTSYLWHMVGGDLFLFCSEMPELEGRVSPGACVWLSHIPIADTNYAIVAGGSNAEARLREFHQLITDDVVRFFVTRRTGC